MFKSKKVGPTKKFKNLEGDTVELSDMQIKQKCIESFNNFKDEYIRDIPLDKKLEFLHENFPLNEEVQMYVGGEYGFSLFLKKFPDKYEFHTTGDREKKNWSLILVY